MDSWTDGWGPVDTLKRAWFRTILRTFWSVGCHPSVLCPRSGVQPLPVPRLEVKEGKTLLTFQRAKTGRILRSRIPEDLSKDLEAYLDFDRPVPYHLLKTGLKQLNAAAGLDPPVTALRYRHRVGLELTRKQGPGVAQRVLGVSDRVLKHYTTLSDDRAVDAAYEALNEESAPMAPPT